MFEIKSLASSLKEDLYDRLLRSIEQEFSTEAIAPPAELLPYLKGKKMENEPLEERRRIRQIFDEWVPRVAGALNSGMVTWEEFLNILPSGFREDFEAAMTRRFREEHIRGGA
jgi:hypothetical protein